MGGNQRGVMANRDWVELALARLEQDLRKAERTWVSDAPNPKRLAVLGLINGIIEFIRANPVWKAERLDRVLEQCAVALLDLDDTGQISPTFRVTRGKGAPTTSVWNLKERGQLSAIIHGLMKFGGMRKREAAAAVAKGLSARGITGVSKDNLLNWRKESSEGIHKFQSARYRADWSEPQRCAEQLLDNFVDRRLQKK
jgi:hypothetical protein